MLRGLAILAVAGATVAMLAPRQEREVPVVVNEARPVAVTPCEMQYDPRSGFARKPFHRGGVFCKADIDEDGVIGVVDFLGVLGAWGLCPPRDPGLPWDPPPRQQVMGWTLFLSSVDGQPPDYSLSSECPADIDCDGDVDVTDFLLVLQEWGRTPP